jgi:hypothetical protein
VHTWDVATSIDREWRPDDETARIVAGGAALVPGGPAREGPGAAFAPVIEAPDGADPWTSALALLGRRA